MATSIERCKEIAESVLDIGVDRTAEKYDLQRESVRRMVRVANAEDEPGEPITVTRENLLKKLDHLSDDELSKLVRGSTQKPHEKQVINFDGETIKFLSLGDTHIGSSYFDDDKLLRRSQGSGVRVHASYWRPARGHE